MCINKTWGTVKGKYMIPKLINSPYKQYQCKYKNIIF